MADTVRYLMEEMIPELEDFQTRGYFSKAEIRAVAKRRQDFEYLLKRRAALKQDYLRCGPRPPAAALGVGGDWRCSGRWLDRGCHNSAHRGSDGSGRRRRCAPL